MDRSPPDPDRVVVAVVGDVVASRRFADEGALLEGLRHALHVVEAVTPGARPLEIGVRDAFHGLHTSVGSAVRAALRLRLATDDLVLDTLDGPPRAVELRLGLGVGSAPTDAEPGGGSAWRHASDARAEAQALPARRGWPPSLRSRCHADDPGVAAALNAHLLLQDQLLARLDTRDRRALLGQLDGERQVDVATELGISQPAVARRLRDRGGLALHRALVELDAVAPAAVAAPGPSAVSEDRPEAERGR